MVGSLKESQDTESETTLSLLITVLGWTRLHVIFEIEKHLK